MPANDINRSRQPLRTPLDAEKPAHGLPASRRLEAHTALEPPQKAQKKSRGDFHIPPRTEPPHDTPNQRKTSLRIFTGAGPPPNDTLSPLIYHTQNDSPTPGADVPLPSPTPSCSPSPSSATSPTVRPCPPTTPAAQQQPQAPLAPTLPHLTPGTDAAEWIPPHNELMTMKPVSQDDNPYKYLQAGQPAPALLPSGRPPHQHNTGRFHANVFEENRLLDGVEPGTAATIRAAREECLALPIFNGGQRLTTCTIQISRPAPEYVQVGGWSEKYKDPFCLFLRVLDPIIRATLLGYRRSQSTATSHSTSSPSTHVLSWVIGLWVALPTTIDIATLTRNIRAALFILVANNPLIVARIAQATQGILVGSAAQRALALARSADAQYIPHPTDPFALIRPHNLFYDMTAFTPKSAGGPPECVVCKHDTHLAYTCPFTGVGNPPRPDLQCPAPRVVGPTRPTIQDHRGHPRDDPAHCPHRCTSREPTRRTRRTRRPPPRRAQGTGIPPRGPWVDPATPPPS
ncbi:hypothetical protein B0H10DRAFT_2216404 [Mycena sp. CBHHK59/15]|nr:hypothetical protein B0H10DRAFT_2216404 [Mycena sp. CBHHK59/15]